MSAPGPRKGEPRGPGLRLGRVLGIPVYVTPSWLVIAALITWTFAPSVRARVPDIANGMSYAVAFGFAVLLYTSVFLHELGHSVVARAFGLPVRRITIHAMVGLSEIEKEPGTPAREFLVAAAGPAVSVLLAVGGWLLAGRFGDGTIAAVVVDGLWLSNGFVAVLNLLPGLPLDGGRIVRAGLWRLGLGPTRSTVWAAWAGRVVAVLVIAYPVVMALRAPGQTTAIDLVLFGIVGAFLWMGASSSLASARVRQAAPSLSAGRLARRAAAVTADTPVSEALRVLSSLQAGALVVVDRATGVPDAIVSEAAVAATPEHRRPWVSAGTLARRLDPGLILPAAMSGEALLERVSGSPSGEFLVVEPDGRSVGVLARTDLAAAMRAALAGSGG